MPHQEAPWESVIGMINRGSDFSILEEAVDVRVQKDFMQLRSRMAIDREHFEEVCSDSIDNIDMLFDNSIDNTTKKRMLVVLSTVDDIPVFRALEKFVAMDTPIKNWATVALQQSRMIIETSLMNNNPGVFISSGLGGKGNKLRYFCVLPYHDTDILEQFQEELVYKELLFTIKNANGEIERFGITNRYISSTILLPIYADIKSIFKGVVDECNTYGNFLSESVLITNVKRFSDEEIQKHISRKTDDDKKPKIF